MHLIGRISLTTPFMASLLDRIDLPSYDPAVGGVVVNPSRAFYIMNPTGDLKYTQGKFQSWAARMHNVGWRGLVGRVPMELEMEAGLENSDLFL